MLTYRKLKNSITGTFNGKPFNLPNTKVFADKLEKYSKKEPTQEEFFTMVKSSRSEEVAGSNEFLTFNPMTGEYYLCYKNYKSEKPIPKSLVRIIERSFDENIDFLPIVKMWARVLNNPRLKSNPNIIPLLDEYISTTWTDKEESAKLVEEEKYTKEAADQLCTYKDIAITKEGLLATYKVARIVEWEYKVEWNEEAQEFIKVKKNKYKAIPDTLDPVTGEVLEKGGFEKPEFAEDYVFTPAIYTHGDKFYSGKTLGYVYKVGEMQHLPKKAKRNVTNTFGGGGLYIGGLRYVEGMSGTEDTRTLTCFVNPADIISFQADGHAIRVDALYPNNVWDDDVQLKGTYHSSDYDKLSTKRLADLIKRVSKKSK